MVDNMTAPSHYMNQCWDPANNLEDTEWAQFCPETDFVDEGINTKNSPAECLHSPQLFDPRGYSIQITEAGLSFIK